jgi:hypothetical protein
MKKQVNELNQKRVKTLSGKDLQENKMNTVLERMKAFCKIAYQLYLNSIHLDKPTMTKQLEAEPPKEFTKAT